MSEDKLCKACRSGAPDWMCTCSSHEEICDVCELPLSVCACEDAEDYDAMLAERQKGGSK